MLDDHLDTTITAPGLHQKVRVIRGAHRLHRLVKESSEDVMKGDEVTADLRQVRLKSKLG